MVYSEHSCYPEAHCLPSSHDMEGGLKIIDTAFPGHGSVCNCTKMHGGPMRKASMNDRVQSTESVSHIASSEDWPQ